MGIDASVLFYRGDVMTPDAWASGLAPVLTHYLSGETLALVHAEGVLHADDGTAFHSITFFQGGETAAKRALANIRAKRSDAVADLAKVAQGEARSLSQIVQAAYKLAREELATCERAMPRRASWLPQVARALSEVRGDALWVMECDHSNTRAFAWASHGVITRERDVDAEADEGDVEADVSPDAALAHFSGRDDASVHACYRGPLDGPAAELTHLLVARDGALLPVPLVVAREELVDFEHVLLDFD